MQQQTQAPLATKQAGRDKLFCGGYNSAKNQRQRLMDYLLQRHSVNTHESRDFKGLDIYHLSARIMELRKAGHDIAMEWIEIEPVPNRQHRIGSYSLMAVNYNRLTETQTAIAQSRNFPASQTDAALQQKEAV